MAFFSASGAPGRGGTPVTARAAKHALRKAFKKLAAVPWKRPKRRKVGAHRPVAVHCRVMRHPRSRTPQRARVTRCAGVRAGDDGSGDSGGDPPGPPPIHTSDLDILDIGEGGAMTRATASEPEPEIGASAFCDVCGCAPCQTPGFCTASRAADADPRVIAERKRAQVLSQREDRAASTTFAAALYALHKDGQSALRGQAERLRQFSDRQLEDLIRRLHKAGGDRRLLRALTELLP